MAPFDCLFSVHQFIWSYFLAKDLIHRNSVVTATGKILEWVSAAEPLSFGQTCLPFPLAHSCGANAALSQPHHRKTQKPGMSRSRWRNWRGHVLPKKLALFKDLFHSDPSVLSRGDTSVSGGHGTENRYNWELSFCGQNACSVAAFPWPRFRSSPQELYRIPWECCHKHAYCAEHTSHLLRLNHCVTANTHESNHSVSTWAQIQARIQFSTPLFTMWYNIRWYIIYHLYHILQCNMIRYDALQDNTIPDDMIWYNMIWYNTIRWDAIPNDTIRYHTIPYDTMWCVNKNSKWCKHDLLPLWTQSQKIKKRQWEHNVHTKKCTRKVSETRYKKCRKKNKVMGKKQVEAARKQQHTNQSPEQWFGIFGLSTVLLKLWAKRTRTVLDNCCLTAWDVLFWNSTVICPSKLKSYWVLFFFFFHLGPWSEKHDGYFDGSSCFLK